MGDIFDVEPPRELVVHQGKNVTLECIIKPSSQCAWKVDAPDLTATGFLKSVIPGNLKIKARDKTSETDCTIIITDIDETYNGRYTCSPYTANGGQQDSEGTNLVIASELDVCGDAPFRLMAQEILCKNNIDRVLFLLDC